MKYFKFIIIAILLIACKKKQEPITNNELLVDGILVLNEGLFEHNNASLSWVNKIDYSVNNSFFEQKTGRNLGDTGNDIAIYGGKLYIIVNVSSTIEVLDLKTGKSIKQILMQNGSNNKQPRSIAFFQGKAYVSCFDGYVDVLDTNTLTINKRIQVGLNPDKIIMANQKIFVANSGGLNSPEMDSTVSVIDPILDIETNKIVVGKNPGDLVADQNGNVFVQIRGNYGTIPSRLKRINTSLQVDFTNNFNVNKIASFENNILIYYQNNGNHLGIFDPNTLGIIQNDLINLSNIQTLYGLQYDVTTQKIIITDAINYTTSGKLLIFSKTGYLENSFNVGLNPSKAILF